MFRRNLETIDILHRPPGSNPHKWFRFDDGEIIEAKMDNDEVHV